MIGKKILGYTIEKQIGSGAFGTVYKVVKTNVFGTYVRALKHITIPNQNEYADVLHSMGGDYAKADDYFANVLKNVVNEIQIISTLSDKDVQNIVKYYENDIEETPSPKKYNIYILMEYLNSFSEYINTKELYVRDVIKLGKDILKALISCHKLNIIHRDIKDDNIFVTSDGTYKLGDFGISKVLTKRSYAESRKGTPYYIAPEVFLGKEKYDDTVDIYSLGILIYKLLNKSRYPFFPEYPAIYNSNDEEIAFRKRMEGEKAKLPCDAKNILGEVVLKAIAKRSERYNSAQEFYDALQNAEESLLEKDLSKKINHVIENVEAVIEKQSLPPDNNATFRLFSLENSIEETVKDVPEKSDRDNTDKILTEREEQTQKLEKVQEQTAATEEILTKKSFTIRHDTEKQEKKIDFSLFNLGRVLKNKKHHYNQDALMRGKEPYLKAMELNELIKKVPDHHSDLLEVKKMFRNVMERLRNESNFGYGQSSVIACENEIVNCLSTIEKNLSALYDDNMVGETANTIMSICKNIQSKLNIRMELKKK